MRIARLETIHLEPRRMIVRDHADKGPIGAGEATLEDGAFAEW